MTRLVYDVSEAPPKAGANWGARQWSSFSAATSGGQAMFQRITVLSGTSGAADARRVHSTSGAANPKAGAGR